MGIGHRAAAPAAALLLLALAACTSVRAGPGAGSPPPRTSAGLSADPSTRDRCRGLVGEIPPAARIDTGRLYRVPEAGFGIVLYPDLVEYPVPSGSREVFGARRPSGSGQLVVQVAVNHLGGGPPPDPVQLAGIQTRTVQASAGSVAVLGRTVTVSAGTAAEVISCRTLALPDSTPVLHVFDQWLFTRTLDASHYDVYLVQFVMPATDFGANAAACEAMASRFGFI